MNVFDGDGAPEFTAVGDFNSQSVSMCTSNLVLFCRLPNHTSYITSCRCSLSRRFLPTLSPVSHHTLFTTWGPWGTKPCDPWKFYHTPKYHTNILPKLSRLCVSGPIVSKLDANKEKSQPVTHRALLLNTHLYLVPDALTRQYVSEDSLSNQVTIFPPPCVVAAVTCLPKLYR